MLGALYAPSTQGTEHYELMKVLFESYGRIDKSNCLTDYPCISVLSRPLGELMPEQFYSVWNSAAPQVKDSLQKKLGEIIRLAKSGLSLENI